ncbi:hypothetical protein JTE90_024590 [Oedothorax gibbosus]|uniref:Glucose-methanol-choline oxidoreductase N-terminal domain-containing protein n=1 Tax=Oedothorax gibbosus TaxID=931172 RepID=A0AAV6VC79_9ARAC|nr:hypothetical protein JTE90_024590 [Oedothorax gibbosus]
MDLAAERAYPTPFANSSLLPILLLSLMQQQHTPSNTATTSKDEYDFIIVGAGSAGSVVASRLSEVPCVTVLLLEAGKPPPQLTEVPGLFQSFWDSDISWNYKTTPQKHTAMDMVDAQIPWPSGKTLGGTSTINGMLYVRGTYHNYDEWARQGAIGWSYSDVKPYFLKAEDNRDSEYVANGYHVIDGPLTVSKMRFSSVLKEPIFDAARQIGFEKGDPNSHNQTGLYDAEGNIRNGQRCSTAKAYLVPAENRENLDILPNAFVQKVVIRNKTADGVIFENGGHIYFVRAKREVILSAGTVNSAQLLMLSGIGPKKHLDQFNIPVLADLPVGENLQDHAGPAVYYTLSPNFKEKESSIHEAMEDYIWHREGPLTTTLQLPMFYLPIPPNPISDFPDLQLYFGAVPTPKPEDSPQFKPGLVEKYFGAYENSTLLTCLAHNLQPKSRGTVKLQSDDPYDAPLIDPNYFDDPEDIRVTVEGLKICKKLVLSEPLKKYGAGVISTPWPGCEEYFGNDDLYFKCLVRSSAFTLNHQVGTAKMGDPNDPTTVVDPTLKVKGIAGLRVVDASVMPLVPSANTNVPTIMVADKASDIIKSTLDCYMQTPV